jgi:hypothetical protein
VIHSPRRRVFRPIMEAAAARVAVAHIDNPAVTGAQTGRRSIRYVAPRTFSS